MIELQDLRKSYGKVEALRGISTSIARGEIVGLLGPNGAGKTTAMKLLVGYLLPTGGTARVAGIDVTEDPLAVQQRIGYLPESAPLYGEMLVQEYLSFVAEMRGLDAAATRRRIVETAEQWSPPSSFSHINRTPHRKPVLLSLSSRPPSTAQEINLPV